MEDAGRSQPTAISPHTRKISLAFLVVALLMGHTMASMALLVLPAVAPVVAREYGIDASLIGYQISLVSAGMLVTLTLLGNITRRLGACRTNQIGHGAVGTGLALMMAPTPVFLAVGAVVLGLGYGLIGPSFSHLLMRFSPPERRNFIFSLQQTGVPIGGVMAALIAPAIAIAFGWRWAIVLSVLLLGCIIVLMQLGRVRWDDDRDAKAVAVSINPLANFTMVWRLLPLRRVALAGGAFCWAQFCVGAYTVVACVQALDMSLLAAGAILTVVQVFSALGRVLVGWLADALRDTGRVLAWNAALMFVTCMASIWMSPNWPLAAIYALFALHGMTSGAWAGAVLAEVGKLAPQGAVSAAISGALVYINIGKFIGPMVFANTYLLTKSYGWAFASIAIPAVIAWFCLRIDRNTNKNK